MKLIKGLLMAAVLSVTGCQDNDVVMIGGTSVYVIGDSLCNITYQGEDFYNYAWPEIIGVSHNCVSGRPAYGSGLYKIPSVDLIILALGTNDRRQESSDNFRVAYQALLDRVSGDVLCILPNYEREANIIKELCVNTLAAVQPDAFDGVHYEIEAQNSMALIVSNWIDNYSGGLSVR